MMKRRKFLLACALTAWLAFAPLALAQDGGPEAATEVSVALALAPLVATATGIERLLEH